MSYVLDTVVTREGCVIAALSRVGIARYGAGRGALFHCDKQPVAILIRQRDAVLVLAPDGMPMDAGDLDRLKPGILAQFRSEADAPG